MFPKEPRISKDTSDAIFFFFIKTRICDGQRREMLTGVVTITDGVCEKIYTSAITL